MAENLDCFVKKCNSKNYKNSHLCRKHFYQLSKDKREQLVSMKVVHDIGQIETDKYFYFIRNICKCLEPEKIIISLKSLSPRIQVKPQQPNVPQPKDDFIQRKEHIEELLQRLIKLCSINSLNH